MQNRHILNDSTRGATKDLSTNTTAAEATRTQGFLSFDDGGFTLGSDPSGVVNDSIRGPYVAWSLESKSNTNYKHRRNNTIYRQRQSSIWI